MSESPVSDRPGLRERKKAKTKAAIQEHAIRLFRDQGYENTTVEQIADAAEVSQSTFFRYFANKEDVVIYDTLDPILIEAWRAQPAELGPIAAMRAAMKQVFAELDPSYVDEMTERGRLVYRVPELREAMVNDMLRTTNVIAAEVALRCGRSPDEFEVRVFTGAMMGALLAAMLPALQEEHPDYMREIEPAFDFLEKGMPL
jgi:AcrR family transcriptional regulator